MLLQIVAWSVLTMPVTGTDGVSCGSALSRAPGCGDDVAVAQVWGWGLAVVGLVLLAVAVRSVWRLSET